jgi:cell filamentation protein, protein adenylyltransferase
MQHTSARSIGTHSGTFTTGQERIGRCGSLRARRCSAIRENIPAQMDALFAGIAGGARFRDLTSEEFVTRLAGFLAELNAIHPFREGNGRTQLSFAGLIGASVGRPLQLSRVSQRTFLPAMVASFAGDFRPLIAELRLLRE